MSTNDNSSERNEQLRDHGRHAETPTWFWLGLAGIIAIAALIRFVPLGEDDYWHDELHSMGSSAAMRAQFEDFPSASSFRTARAARSWVLNPTWHPCSERCATTPTRRGGLIAALDGLQNPGHLGHAAIVQ